MADEFCFLAHKCGYAVYFGKQLSNDWGFAGSEATVLAKWLVENNPEGYWDYYNTDEGEPWVILRDGTFNKTWTTESGLIFCKKDYVDPSLTPEGHVTPRGVFRIRFLENNWPIPDDERMSNESKTERKRTMTLDDTHTIASLCVRSLAIAREKGWATDTPTPFETSTNLFHSELSEALEEFRAHRGPTEIYYEWGGQAYPTRGHVPANGGEPKPAGIPIELADLVIRICHVVGADGFQERLNTDVTWWLSTEHFDPLAYARLPEATFQTFLADTHVFLSQAYSIEGRRYYFLALAVAACFQYCRHHGIDLWAAIDMKEAFNRTRPFRHGGKAC